MPELPEVDTIRRQLAGLVEGCVITAATAHPSAKFSDAVTAVGGRIDVVRRRGKYLLMDLDDARELVVHLGMTGSLRVDPDRTRAAADPYTRASWTLDDAGEFVFRDVRRFGRIAVVEAGDYARLPTLAELGPEPFDETFDGAHLWRGVRAGRRHIKTVLLGQRLVAGIGNIYADEALWLAGVNPADRIISRARADALVDAIRVVLQAGLDHGGTTLRDYVDAAGGEGGHQHHLHCYGRFDEPCDRCGTVLRRAVIDARTTTWCPDCQPRRG